jgi:hypothetical protein
MKMKTLVRFLTVAMVGVFASALVFGQNSVLTVRAMKHDRSAQTAVRAARTGADAISAENVNNYFMGGDFVSSRNFILSEDQRNAITQLAVLWDELQGQPEAAQMEALLRMQIRGSGTVKDRLNKLDAVQSAVETRFKGEQKWFYNVGKSYTQMYTALNGKDIVAMKNSMVELGNLAKTAPASSPATFTTALATLGQMGGKSSLTDAEIAIVQAQFDAIDKMIYA